jgi:hypothetical protein
VYISAGRLITSDITGMQNRASRLGVYRALIANSRYGCMVITCLETYMRREERDTVHEHAHAQYFSPPFTCRAMYQCIDTHNTACK